MRRYSNLYDVNISDINDVYKEIRKSVRNKNKIYRFENYYSLNISKIKEVLDSDYKCGKYNIFLIREPKYRVIMSQNIFDKVINHIVARDFLYVLDKVLIDSNVATRKDKGTSLGVKYIKKYLRYCLDEINNFVLNYGLKLNNKTKIINVSKEGLDFLGFRFYKGYIKIRSKNMKRFKRKIKLYKKGIISDDFINGYRGYFKIIKKPFRAL